MKAAELRDKAKLWLRARYPEALITHELSVAEYGGALVDVAAVLPDQIIGVEIKGEGDSPTRLARQGYLYSRVCRTMWLLTCPSLEARCAKHKPDGWGTILSNPPEDKYNSYTVCPDSGMAVYKYSGADKTGYGLSPVALAAMPWTKEYREFEHLLKTNLPATKAKCIEAVVNRFPLRQIETAVCAVLRQRNWELKDVDMPASERAAIAAEQAKGRLL